MAQNDPQWGKRGNDGPPDLDELIKKMTARLSGMFGGKPNGQPPTSGGGKVFAGGAGLIGGVVAALWLASGFYSIDPSEHAVITRFGKAVDEVADAGLHWRWPYPIERHEVVNMSGIRAVEVGHRGGGRTKVPEEALMVTGDQNIIDVQFAVQYQVENASNFLFSNAFIDPDGKDLVLQVAESAIREVVGRNKIDFTLNEGRATIARDTEVLMAAMLKRYKSGIRITSVQMRNAQPPEQVQAAFDDANKAGQDKDRLKSEGEAYANDVVPKARGLAARLQEEAIAHRQRVVSTAEGDVSRFNQIYAEYKKAPAVTRERMYIDMMQQVMTNTSKVVVDQKGGSNLLYLPLDKLMQMNNPASLPATSSPTSSGTDNLQRSPVEVMTQPVDLGRGRGREREGR
ncbi:membrane protease subunit HflK [Chitinivorax tropicus]|uniref:Protein HflK n=1 Tax=Chitinivorax tropicus TaxID=714531 RepID=A0A840MMZ6_9PROT|nr:FtsH protease activity modulator HflK [Chitinivorax tropicus]MBB5019790.1 membrane protease subunit HflK [Chitinivorax tropicus]